VLINWFTVAAQIVNFLILVALLKRFLYGPIVAAMATREGNIAAQLTEAQQKREAAEQEKAQLRQKIRAIDAQRQEMLTAAERQAEAHKQELFIAARQEMEQIRQKWAASLTREKDTFLQSLKQRLAQEVLTISRRALKGLANLDLEQRLLEVFFERLGQLGPEEQAAIRESIRETGGELLITTAFELPEAMQQQVAARVQEHFGKNLNLRFGTSQELLAGIELLTNSRKLAWSLGNFLDSLEEDLVQALQKIEKSEAA
jgi:F-type H+-transporting ATPase subunit b